MVPAASVTMWCDNGNVPPVGTIWTELIRDDTQPDNITSCGELFV